ncbi:MAG: hypothetical protein ACI88G_000069 [Woeseiaceae bacterium]
MYLNDTRTVSNSNLSRSHLARKDRIGRDADTTLARKYIKRHTPERSRDRKSREIKTVLFLIVELASFLKNYERIIRIEKRRSKILNNYTGSLAAATCAEVREDEHNENNADYIRARVVAINS